jgi:DtxR family Mn-dependent transcriptional regulator
MEEEGLKTADRGALPTELRCFRPFPIEPSQQSLQDTVEAGILEGWVTAQDSKRIVLSNKGRAEAKSIVRRHRLTESLLAGVLHVSDASVESTACQAEHILNEEVTEAVCSFLGHPPVCPHQRAIPRGSCCQRSAVLRGPLLVPLSRFAEGEEGRIAFIHTRRWQYVRQLSLVGLIPGARIRVQRLRPALVIEVGQTEFALDKQAADEIFVRRRWDHAG